MLGVVYARTQETHGEVVEEQQYYHSSSLTKTNHNFPWPHHTCPWYKSIKDYTCGIPSGNCKRVTIIWAIAIFVHVGAAVMDHDLTILVSTNEGRYLPTLLKLPLW